MDTSYDNTIAPSVNIPGALEASTTLSQTAPAEALTTMGPEAFPTTVGILASPTIAQPPRDPDQPATPRRKGPRMLVDLVRQIQERQELEARAAATGASAEDLRPNKPDLVVVTHDTQPPLPSMPEDYTSSSHVVFRLHVSLPVGDDRVSSLRLMMTRIQAIIEGELLTPPEKLEAAVPDSPIAKNVASLERKLDTRHSYGSGRPTLPRRGLITDADGRNESQFNSMSDLASQLCAPYAAVNQKYLRACREQGKDPNMNDGVFFTYKGARITLTAGVFNPEDHVDLG